MCPLLGKAINNVKNNGCWPSWRHERIRSQYPDTLHAPQSAMLAGNGRARSVYEFQFTQTV
jgi:hypothetical protein